MMVIYLPVKFEFDWTNQFHVRVRKLKLLTDRQMDKTSLNSNGQSVFELESKNENVNRLADGRRIHQCKRWVGSMQPT